MAKHKPLLVRDAMSRGLRTASPDDTVAEAALTMRESGHGVLPVVDGDGQLVGLLKKSTLVRSCLPTYLEDVVDLVRSGVFAPFRDKVEEVGMLPVRDLMTPAPPLAGEDTPLAQVAAVMIMNDARQVFVVEEDELVGMVGLQDIVDAIAWPQPKPAARR
jgi:CBS domain-containing protein